MDQLTLRLIAFVSHQDNPIGLAVLALSAALEYVFPPFPGDTITLFGAFLITSHDWNFLAVFGAVLVGSGGGAMLDFWFGRWLKRRELAHEPRHPRARAQIDRLVERFRRHGEVYIVLNRFLPAIRALFFVAAGMAGLRARWVLVWAMVSAALWNLLIIAVGSAVGANFAALKGFVSTYSRLVWIALGLLALAWLVRALVGRLRARARRRATGD